MPPTRLLLLHGVWMRAFTLAPLARRLRAAGFACEGFDYLSLRHGPGPSRERLGARLAGMAGPVGLVGHSLGGLLALDTLARHPELPVTRVLCLGSPLAGSRVATRLAGHGWLRRAVLGASAGLLTRGLGAWEGDAAVGVIAGTRGFGAGRVIGALPSPHDGTVSVAETRIPGLADHIELPVTHTGMLFSAEVGRQAAHFLAEGRFLKADGCKGDGGN